MSENPKDFFREFKKAATKMNKLMPDAVGAFGNLFSNTMAEGTISLKHKELIALGIAVAIQCEPCIRLHTQKCLNAGATKEEIIEALGVTIMMGGGPAYTHIPVVIETLEALQQ